MSSSYSSVSAGVGVGGGLSIFGCLWRVASDDLVLPSLLETVFRIVGVAIVVGVLVYEEIAEFSCVKEFHLDLYLIVAVVIFTATIVNLILLGYHSSRGVIWDQNPRLRRFVTPLIYLNIFLTLCEFVWALVGSVWVVKGLMAQCVKPGEITTKDIPLYAISGVIVTTWIALVLKIILSCISFNSVDLHEKNSDNNETLILESRPSLASKFFSLCMKKTQIQLFKDVANVLADVFDDKAFVPTDIAAALLLIYARQTPVSNQASTCSIESTVDRTELKDPQKIVHFMHYAGAAYGYTWFLMRDTICNLNRMRPYISCCSCCCPCMQEQDLIEADNCFHCNTAALKAMLPFIDTESLVHISFKNKLLEVPYFVALDHRFKKIVIAIRGTLSLEDTLTDLCARPEVVSEVGVEFLAHSGMIKAARYVLEELRTKNILNKALSYYDTYDIVVTGHSLGAGTAAILALILKQTYHNVECYAYSPPGGLFNEKAASKSKEFTLSLIVGKDLVPRLSFQSLNLLKEEMKRSLIDCGLPKYQILASGLTSFCVKDWRRQLLMQDQMSRTYSESSADSRDAILTMSERGDDYNSIDSSDRGRNQCQEPMILPGILWHLEMNENRNGYRLSEKTQEDFKEILVSPKMLTDHFPNQIIDVLTESFADPNLSF